MKNYSTNVRYIAERFHDTYEEIARQEGWNTQKTCKVPFSELPKKNQITMLEVVKRLMESEELIIRIS